jgi:hypothetical protein
MLWRAACENGQREVVAGRREGRRRTEIVLPRSDRLAEAELRALSGPYLEAVWGASQPNVWHQRRAQRVRCMPGLDARTEVVGREFECDGQGSVQLSDLRRRQGADVMSERCLG